MSWGYDMSVGGGGDTDVTQNKKQLTRTTNKKVVSYEKAKNPARVDTDDDIGDRHWAPTTGTLQTVSENTSESPEVDRPS